MNVRSSDTSQGSSLRRRLAAWASFVSLVAAVGYANRFAGGSPDRDALYRWSTVAGELLVFAVILAATLAIAGRHRSLFALRRPASWRRALLLSLAVLAVVYPVVALLDPLLHGGREQGLTPTGWQSSHAAAYVVNALVIAGVAPFCEELLFRGLGFSLLAQRRGSATAIVATGLAFGVYHGLVQALPSLVLIGCALAWLRARTRSVYPGMLVHATFNAVALIGAVTVG